MTSGSSTYDDGMKSDTGNHTMGSEDVEEEEFYYVYYYVSEDESDAEMAVEKEDTNNIMTPYDGGTSLETNTSANLEENTTDSVGVEQEYYYYYYYYDKSKDVTTIEDSRDNEIEDDHDEEDEVKGSTVDVHDGNSTLKSGNPGATEADLVEESPENGYNDDSTTKSSSPGVPEANVAEEHSVNENPEGDENSNIGPNGSSDVGNNTTSTVDENPGESGASTRTSTETIIEEDIYYYYYDDGLPSAEEDPAEDGDTIEDEEIQINNKEGPDRGGGDPADVGEDLVEDEESSINDKGDLGGGEEDPTEDEEGPGSSNNEHHPPGDGEDPAKDDEGLGSSNNEDPPGVEEGPGSSNDEEDPAGVEEDSGNSNNAEDPAGVEEGPGSSNNEEDPSEDEDGPESSNNELDTSGYEEDPAQDVEGPIEDDQGPKKNEEGPVGTEESSRNDDESKDEEVEDTSDEDREEDYYYYYYYYEFDEDDGTSSTSADNLSDSNTLKSKTFLSERKCPDYLTELEIYKQYVKFVFVTEVKKSSAESFQNQITLGLLDHVADAVLSCETQASSEARLGNRHLSSFQSGIFLIRLENDMISQVSECEQAHSDSTCSVFSGTLELASKEEITMTEQMLTSRSIQDYIDNMVMRNNTDIFSTKYLGPEIPPLLETSQRATVVENVAIAISVISLVVYLISLAYCRYTSRVRTKGRFDLLRGDDVL